MEISVVVNDDFVRAMGIETVKGKLHSFASHLELSAAAQEALAELTTIDLINDPQW